MMENHGGSFTCKLRPETADLLVARGLTPRIDEEVKSFPRTYHIELPAGWSTFHRGTFNGLFYVVVFQWEEIVGSGVVGEELFLYRRV